MASGIRGLQKTLIFQLSLCMAAERGELCWGPPGTVRTHDAVRPADGGRVTGDPVWRGGRGKARHGGEAAVNLS